jgi:tRNA(Ile)-lysidine synthase
MLRKFQNHVQDRFPFLQAKKLLIAVSGGIDSMVLCDLLLRSSQDFAIAHCNFNLRGVESDGDEQFVKSYAAQKEIPFFSMRFDTEAFANDQKLSVQVAARELRYAWFAELLNVHKFDFVLTAHHADDNFETFLINISRGTGLAGLVGIPAENGKIIRPLLNFSRKEIESYAIENDVKWCEDSSNSSNKYLRNQLRHGVVPILKNINPNFIESFAETLSHLQQSQSLVEDAAKLVYKQVAVELENKVLFKISELKRLPNYRAYLYQWLNDFGFTAWEDIYDLVDAQSGKQVFAADFVLLKDREVLELLRKEIPDNQVYTIDKDTKEVNFPLNLSFCRVTDVSQANAHCIFVAEEKLAWPLTVRKWRDGDWFYPIGMTGKKKVSKFFKDEKFSLADKADAWLLCSGDAVVWIIGKRMDDRFKITDTTKHILQIKS